MDYLSNLNIDALYFSVDIDGIDSSEVSATGTPEKGWLLVNDLCEIIKILGDKYEVVGSDLVEVAPMVNNNSNNSVNHEPQSTLNAGVRILSQLKKVF